MWSCPAEINQRTLVLAFVQLFLMAGDLAILCLQVVFHCRNIGCDRRLADGKVPHLVHDGNMEILFAHGGFLGMDWRHIGGILLVVHPMLIHRAG
jgi:hypothetical protein